MLPPSTFKRTSSTPTTWILKIRQDIQLVGKGLNIFMIINSSSNYEKQIPVTYLGQCITFHIGKECSSFGNILIYNLKSNQKPIWFLLHGPDSILSALERIVSQITGFAPILRVPTTILTALYTALNLTMNINAMVVGESKRTVVTLDLDLYEAGKLREAANCKDKLILNETTYSICCSEELRKIYRGI